jgi:predicted PurR-regulated permease PerM
MQEKPWNIQTRYFILVILLLITAVVIYYARPLIAPLMVAALLAYVLDPAVELFMRRTGQTRRLVVPLVYAGFLIALAAIPAIFTPVIYAQLDAIQSEVIHFQESLEAFLIQTNLTGFFQVDDISEIFSFLYNPAQIFGVMLAATENLAWILIIAVTTFYILLDWDRLRTFLLELPPEPYRHDIQILYTRLRGIWQAYLRGQLLLMIIVGTLSWLVGSLVGLPDALLIGILAGALDVIPSLGPIVALVIATLVALFQGSYYLALSNIWFALLVFGLFFLIQIVENIWLRPRILSQSLRLHPALVFVAIIGALALAGVVAALVIVPVIKSSEVLGSYLIRRMLGLDPWTDWLPEGTPTPRSHRHTDLKASRARRRLQKQIAPLQSYRGPRVRGRTRSHPAK